MPTFLKEKNVEPEVYERWLRRKAMTLVKRDRRQRKSNCTVSGYKQSIHEAVKRSNGNDAYTGERLAWERISKYNNEESKKGRHKYKAEFALLPTVDHVTADAKDAEFCICSWRTNDAKNDLSLDAFLELCESVLKHHGFQVERNLVNA